MPTSSIIEDIRVNNPMVLVEYVKAMEKHANEEVRPRTDEGRSGVCDDPQKIKALMDKVRARNKREDNRQI